jgi:transcription elongation factor Elf1
VKGKMNVPHSCAYCRYGREALNMSVCGHNVCLDCLWNQVRKSLQKKEWRVKCLDETCNKIYDYEILKKHIPATDYEKYLDIRSCEFVNNCINRGYCSRCGEGEVKVVDKGENAGTLSCVHCKNSFKRNGEGVWEENCGIFDSKYNEFSFDSLKLDSSNRGVYDMMSVDYLKGLFQEFSEGDIEVQFREKRNLLIPTYCFLCAVKNNKKLAELFDKRKVISNTLNNTTINQNVVFNKDREILGNERQIEKYLFEFYSFYSFLKKLSPYY